MQAACRPLLASQNLRGWPASCSPRNSGCSTIHPSPNRPANLLPTPHINEGHGTKLLRWTLPEPPAAQSVGSIRPYRHPDDELPRVHARAFGRCSTRVRLVLPVESEANRPRRVIGKPGSGQPVRRLWNNIIRTPDRRDALDARRPINRRSSAKRKPPTCPRLSIDRHPR